MKFFYFVFASFLLAACGYTSKEEAPLQQDAAGLQNLLNEKKLARQRLSREIEDIESQIRTLNPNTKITKRLITSMQVQRSTFSHYTTVQGNVAADEIVGVSSETGGRIIKLMVQEGDLVTKGVLIAEIDMESLDKQIEEVEKALELAIDLFDRQSRLWDQEIGSEVQYLQAKNNKERLEKSLETLESQRSKSKISAPIAGVIDKVFLEQGEVAGPAIPIVEILNPNRLKVVADVPENLIRAVRKGDWVKVTFPALAEEQKARISMVGRTIDQANRTFKIELSLSGSSRFLKPNLLTEIEINDYTQTDAIVIPIELVQQEVSGEDFVMLVHSTDDGFVAKKLYVTTGDSYLGDIIITKGLTEGEYLVREGAQLVSDGERLEVVADKEKAVIE